jgi:glutamate dehydrogenase
MQQKDLSAVLHTRVRPPKSVRALNWRRYLGIYFSNVDAEDLANRDPQELAGAALSHLMFAMRRRRAALVRVFNPTLREHGFVSPHTIIDVVNDDMPFLVDSISLALQERSLTLHFLAHPVFAVERNAGGVLRTLQRRAGDSDTASPRLESFQHLEIDRIVDPAALSSLAAAIERALRDVRVAYADWARMRRAAHLAAEDLAAQSARSIRTT